MLSFTFTFCQFKGEVGLEIGRPFGEGDVPSVGLGIVAQGEYTIKEKIGFTFQTGYTRLKSSVDRKNTSMIPLMVGFKWYFLSKEELGVFIHTKSGTYIYRSTSLWRGANTSTKVPFSSGLGIGCVINNKITSELNFTVLDHLSDPRFYASIKVSYNF